MEESEERRKRLTAMRMEAVVDSSSSSSSYSSSSSSLSNPLVDKLEESPSTVQRFGFYTDPMAAFSSDKRRSTLLPHSDPRSPFPPSPSGRKSYEMPVYGVHQTPSSYSPYQNMHHSGDPYYSPRPPTSPMGMRSPYPMHQGGPNFNPGMGRGHQFNNSPTIGSGPGGKPYPVHQGSPDFRSPLPGRVFRHNNSGSPGHGRGYGRGGSPSPGFGRGRGRWDGSGRGSGPRYSGGGRGSYSDGRAQSFYHKSMVEDPWKFLTPVVWKAPIDAWTNFNNRVSSQKTPTSKKPRVSYPSSSSNSQPSLAEYLAASFDEAVGDATDT